MYGGVRPKGLAKQYFKRFSIVIIGLLSGHSVIHNVFTKPNMKIPTINLNENNNK